jgi:glycosyltransferase involved in cell wall biosynthesis
MSTANPPLSDVIQRLSDQPDGIAVLDSIHAYARRPTVRGKFLFVGNNKYWVKGVTYGTFSPNEDGSQFPSVEVVDSDFAAMAENDINTIRTYTPAPRWLLDTAQRHGLRVMVGLAWEQHITFLDDAAVKRRIRERVRADVRACAGHPALLCFSIGNEIPPSIVRWHGHRRIERFLHSLYKIAKAEDPDVLVTYVNYPTTEYLQLSFLDLICFNVYLEVPEKLEAYLARLQNIAGEKPLLMAEIGLDSQRNGEYAQATSLHWQIQIAFAGGCAGAFVFAWTDEWYRGGYDIEDWDFGITTRARKPKTALSVVRKAYAEAPFSVDGNWPLISVVVCSYNGARTIRDTLEGLRELAYPNYEVIVVNDGSTDATPIIAAEYDFRLINTENRGLSNARNTGWQAARGEIVAYIDDDAYPDPHWLHYLSFTLMHTDYVGVGGPNIAPPGDGPIADCVANAPGGPVHVLLSDTEAEHIPGCNMAFRRGTLADIGGFDPRYRTAGDDVDVCWRLQAQGGKIGFHAAAMNWHHRRNSVKTYWKQQQGYGKAEALLEEKWFEKYNAAGHFSWSGRLYGKGLTEALRFSSVRVYGGPWGSALFQSVYEPATSLLSSLPLMPEWYLITAVLGALSLLGLAWSPLLWCTPLFAMGLLAPIAQAILSALKAEFPTPRPDPVQRLALRALTAVLHLMQPLARFIGRLRHGLTPWRRRIQATTLRWRRSYNSDIWNERWHAPEAWLESVVERLKRKRVSMLLGGEFDAWDLELRGGLFGAARTLMAIEEHGSGKQMVRFRVWPKFSVPGVVLGTLFKVLAIGAALDGAWAVASLLVMGGSLVFARAWLEYVTPASTLWSLLCEESNG